VREKQDLDRKGRIRIEEREEEFTSPYLTKEKVVP
jgi:hypothetical protein